MPKNIENKQESKSRYLTFELYPDNRYHMNYLDYLKLNENGFYIVHEPDKLINNNINFEQENFGMNFDKKNMCNKKHMHVVICFKNARTVSGFLKTLPVCNYVRLSDGTLSSNLSFNCLDLEHEEIVQEPLLKYAECVRDITAICKYLTHSDYKSTVLNKRKYLNSDVKGFGNGLSVFQKYVNSDDDSDIIEVLYQFASATNGSTFRFMEYVTNSKNINLIKYVQSHAYFVERFLLKPFQEVVTVDLSEWEKIL